MDIKSLKIGIFLLQISKKIIENEFTLKYMSNEQIIILVEILNSIKSIDRLYNYKESLFEDTGKTTTDFFIIPPDKNQNLPDRSMLLKKIKGKPDNIGIVVDFGDLPLYKLKFALHIYKIKEPELYIKPIFLIITNIKSWIKTTNNEIFISLNDTRIWDKENNRYL